MKFEINDHVRFTKHRIEKSKTGQLYIDDIILANKDTIMVVRNFNFSKTHVSVDTYLSPGENYNMPSIFDLSGLSFSVHSLEHIHKKNPLPDRLFYI